MVLTKLKQVEDFLAAINKCKGNVWMTSVYGDKYNMKSTLTQYVAIGRLVEEKGDDLEIFCENKEDEAYLMKFFIDHPEL